MKFEVSEDYYDLANEWQRQLIELLKETLKYKKVPDDIAKDIIGDFIFKLSMLHDQGEIRVNRKSYNPKICFDDFSETIVGTDEDTYLHEYAFRLTNKAFEK
jgi:hypothetical protein